MPSRTFTLADQQAFARLSGDWNPMHVDAIAARRTLFGECVVHGVHTLLWALAQAGLSRPLASLEAKFTRRVTLGTEVTMQVKEVGETAFALTVLMAGTPVVRAKGTFAEMNSSFPLGPSPTHNENAVELAFDDALATTGCVPLGFDADAFEALLPGMQQALPSWQIAALLASTRIVGMECPGLHSLYAGLTLQFGVPQGAAELCYRVANADERFSSVDLEVTGPGMSGTLRAMFRPSPQRQPGYQEATTYVTKGEFSGWRALVVGGSRGLGEAAAKLVAAGGGAVCLTYFQGAHDAQQIADELSTAGREACIAQLDVTHPTKPELPWQPTHLLYFATPHISGDHTASFSQAKFDRFCQYYVGGFHQLISLHPGALNVLYPSTIFLDEIHPQTAEYCAAKAAGETLCRHLAKTQQGLRIHAPRLPRLISDQTAGITAGSAAAASMPVLLRELRALNHPS